MVSPIQGRAVLDVCAAVEKHKDVMPSLLAAHGITGCDTVGTYSGIGKGLAMKALRSGHSLPLLEEKTLDDVMPEIKSFILACYNQKQYNSMTEARHKTWTSRVSRSTACAPKPNLCVLLMQPFRKMLPGHIYRFSSGKVP